MPKLHYAGYYLPLDLALDTRMGTLARMSEEVAASIDLKKYRLRLNDHFEPFTLEEFKEAYSKRDVETLKYSLPTGFIKVMREEIQKVAAASGTEFNPEKPRIFVNTYPYDLNEEEESELGLILINLFRIEGMELELIRKPIEELTPEYCREHFVFMGMYMEYLAWLDHHRFSLNEKKNEHVVLMVPALFEGKVATDIEVKGTIDTVGLHPLEMLEMTAKEYVDLIMIDVKHFSVIEFGGIKPTSPDVGPIEVTG